MHTSSNFVIFGFVGTKLLLLWTFELPRTKERLLNPAVHSFAATGSQLTLAYRVVDAH